mmetsp:Transcript_31470/g.78969  ORF Transcript_31470/g.78969 Transcript_31470/m.78969 type:complete len:292 (-) Transcript_31470:128-1003(-)|eukprot:CAMPEP_0177658244 /NCGR_PEP_ID=MMETSP0447-20121125/16692_1 /TAXON_ID=0 /ORGANISM="Stygamoeba regulata, Strain BSH-02190019" /LENGTH=291 /DNA_ID=CAMNT_0019162807 /DNA_START=202 /DNA_END=1077 /DNA_ORIENTATION=+
MLSSALFRAATANSSLFASTSARSLGMTWSQPLVATAIASTKSYSISHQELDLVVKKAHHAAIAETLQKDPRVRLTMAEFSKICEQHQITGGEIPKLRDAFNDAGVILHISTSEALRDVLIIKPKKVITGLVKILDTEGDYTASLVTEKKAELEQLESKLCELDTVYRDIDRRAHKSADRVIGLCTAGLLVQGACVARLTWWELSWDIMEPVTYMITFAVVAGGALWFSATKTEYTYESLHNTLANRKRNKLMKRIGFNEKQYREMKQKAMELQKILEAPHQHLIDEVLRE